MRAGQQLEPGSHLPETIMLMDSRSSICECPMQSHCISSHGIMHAVLS